MPQVSKSMLRCLSWPSERPDCSAGPKLPECTDHLNSPGPCPAGALISPVWGTLSRCCRPGHVSLPREMVVVIAHAPLAVAPSLDLPPTAQEAQALSPTSPQESCGPGVLVHPQQMPGPDSGKVKPQAAGQLRSSPACWHVATLPDLLTFSRENGNSCFYGKFPDFFFFQTTKQTGQLGGVARGPTVQALTRCGFRGWRGRGSWCIRMHTGAQVSRQGWVRLPCVHVSCSSCPLPTGPEE